LFVKYERKSQEEQAEQEKQREDNRETTSKVDEQSEIKSIKTDKKRNLLLYEINLSTQKKFLFSFQQLY